MKANEIKKLFRNYNYNKNRLPELELTIEYLESKAEKITPSYSKSEGQTSLSVSSKVEENSVKVVDMLKYRDKLMYDIAMTEELMSHLKSHQRYLIKSCLIYHVSYSKVAEREHTTAKNIERIISNAVKQLERITEGSEKSNKIEV